MDNDQKIIKAMKQLIKAICFTWNYKDIEVLSEEDGNAAIENAILSKNSFAAVRGGATELRCIDEFLKKGNSFSDKIKKEISELSGVFPTTDSNLERFCELYIENMKKADLLALWGVGAEAQLVHKYCTSSQYIKLRSLESYYFVAPWSKALEGKRILVLHPFAETITAQYQKRKQIFPGTNILPEFQSLICVKAVQSIAGQETGFETWFDALDSMKKEVMAVDFDVAIIGAGAYGLPLAIYCKELGKQAIQMSGATQILFGIKGKRWDTHPVINKFYNDSWVRPSPKETPLKKEKVEGGSYW